MKERIQEEKIHKELKKNRLYRTGTLEMETMKTEIISIHNFCPHKSVWQAIKPNDRTQMARG